MSSALVFYLFFISNDVLVMCSIVHPFSPVFMFLQPCALDLLRDR